MGGARSAAPLPLTLPAWRSTFLALCLLPVALPLLLICLPLLCVAVAVARFRRRRSRLLLLSKSRRRSCRRPGERPSPREEEEADGDEDDGHRAALLHKYLEDQVELVGGAGGGGGDLDRPLGLGSQRCPSHPPLPAKSRSC